MKISRIATVEAVKRRNERRRGASLCCRRGAPLAAEAETEAADADFDDSAAEEKEKEEEKEKADRRGGIRPAFVSRALQLRREIRKRKVETEKGKHRSSRNAQIDLGWTRGNRPAMKNPLDSVNKEEEEEEDSQYHLAAAAAAAAAAGSG